MVLGNCQRILYCRIEGGPKGDCSRPIRLEAVSSLDSTAVTGAQRSTASTMRLW